MELLHIALESNASKGPEMMEITKTIDALKKKYTRLGMKGKGKEKADVPDDVAEDAGDAMSVG